MSIDGAARAATPQQSGRDDHISYDCLNSCAACCGFQTARDDSDAFQNWSRTDCRHPPTRRSWGCKRTILQHRNVSVSSLSRYL